MTNLDKSLRLAPLLMALFCIVAWGLSYPVTRSAVQQIPPLTLACIRFFIAAMLLWPLSRAGQTRLLKEDRKWLAGLTLTGITLYFGFENTGLKLTTASHGALIIATIPLGTELVIAWRRRRLPRLATWLGTLAALTGVGLLVGSPDGASSLVGDLLMFGAVGSWIGYTFLVERLSGRYPNLLVTRWIMFWGAVSMLPGTLWELAWQPLPRPDAGAWGGVLFLAVVCSALGYDFWNRAVPALGPSATNTLLYFLPLVGVFGGIFGLGEPVTPGLFVGGALICCGILLARRGQRQDNLEPCHVD